MESNLIGRDRGRPRKNIYEIIKKKKKPFNDLSIYMVYDRMQLRHFIHLANLI